MPPTRRADQASGHQERARTARALHRVIHQGKTTEQSIGTEAVTPLITELLQGSLRHYFSLADRVRAHLNRPFREKDQDLFALMLVGAYQLVYMRIPDHAVINETVGAVTQLKKPWAKGLINAVLRKIAKEAGNNADEASTEHSFELPMWMLQTIRADFPVQAEDVARATTERAPMSIRVNVRRTSVADYLVHIKEAGIDAHAGNFPEHLVLSAPVPVRDLPGYEAGLVSVQDAGAQFAAHLAPASLPENARILDACAAPGGKLFHLAERFPGADLVGLEISADRIEHMQQEATRLGHDNVRLVAGDATARDWLGAACPETPETDSIRFDLILLDAPCTGSGTLRRHPDIKVLRSPADVDAAASLQRRLLDNLWPLLADGGCLIYCTCSLFAAENDRVIEAFLRQANDESIHAGSDQPPATVPERLDLPIGTATRCGWQLLPLPAGEGAPNRSVDGFYFARMTQREKAR